MADTHTQKTKSEIFATPVIPECVQEFLDSLKPFWYMTHEGVVKRRGKNWNLDGPEWEKMKIEQDGRIQSLRAMPIDTVEQCEEAQKGWIVEAQTRLSEKQSKLNQAFAKTINGSVVPMLKTRVATILAREDKDNRARVGELEEGVRRAMLEVDRLRKENDDLRGRLGG